MSVAILIPVLSRPHRVAGLIENVRNVTPAGSYRLLFIASPGDAEEIAELEKQGADFIKLWRHPGRGDYARKINAGFQTTTEDWVFTGADDLAFHPGWLEAALEAAGDAFHVIGTQDLGNPSVLAGVHSTHSIVRRSYVDTVGGTFDNVGEVLHEGYEHEWVDNELVDTAKCRGVWKFADASIVEHLHPLWGKREEDALTINVQKRTRESSAHFRRRRRRWREALGSP